MTNKELTADDALSLLESSKLKGNAAKNEDVFNRWPGKEGMEALAKAVHSKLPFVFIKGIRYKIGYRSSWGGSIFIQPDNGFIPCGYFELQSLTDVYNKVQGAAGG